MPCRLCSIRSYVKPACRWPMCASSVTRTSELSRAVHPTRPRRDNRSQFELYQSSQRISNRKKLTAPYWTVFIVNLDDETMFAGVYAVQYRGLLEQDTPRPHMNGIDEAGSSDVYDLTLKNALSDLIGKLFIDWGPGALAWVQYADRNNKPVTVLRTAFREPTFPGFLNFIQPLSKLDNLPKGWIVALQSSRGVYLLTCPKTKEQYVGSASGAASILATWQDYVRTGLGGNARSQRTTIRATVKALNILEAAGASATTDEARTDRKGDGRQYCRAGDGAESELGGSRRRSELKYGEGS